MPSPRSESSADPFSDFSDIDGFVRIPRVNGLTSGPGGRLVAEISEADKHASRMASALWEIDPAGGQDARRLTFSEKGESSARFSADGSLYFTSARPDPQGSDDDNAVAAIWRLPEHGEAQVVATAPGGLGLISVADDGTLLASTSVLPGGSLADDGSRRKARKDAKQTTIWHTGMPIRYWDSELNDVSPRLLLVLPGGEIVDLVPDADTVNLRGASADLSRDGRTIVTTWTIRVRGAETRTSLVLITADGQTRRTLLAATGDRQYTGPKLSPDANRIAVTRVTAATPTDTSYDFLEIHPVGSDGRAGDPVSVEVGDLTIGEYRWLDDRTLLVAGDLHSRGAVLAVDAATGAVRTLVDDAVYGSLAPAADGSAIFALRSDIAGPNRPVRLTLDGSRSDLPAPGAVDQLPGRLEWVETDVNGLTVGGWLCTPSDATAERPAPVMLWIHGGPHGSYNSWSWRWCPWLAVARGYAVLMPDPAMSTGYGHAGLNRGWPRRADVVFDECETLFDRVLQRPELDGDRTAMLGASFGGFMANWIAGHTDRFDCIVSHAGLWALDQQHRTTDAAAGKMRVHLHEDDNPDWYRTYSPHYAVDKISTPMLITHGNRDYRVPVSEALRLWWELVSRWQGEPETMPHRFLQLTSENHWVLTPSNLRTYHQVVLAFCDQHVRGADPVPAVLPW